MIVLPTRLSNSVYLVFVFVKLIMCFNTFLGDAIPVPSRCPELIEQLLEAALAHHNLGSFEDSLKFLEAARIHLVDADQTSKINADGNRCVGLIFGCCFVSDV